MPCDILADGESGMRAEDAHRHSDAHSAMTVCVVRSEGFVPHLPSNDDGGVFLVGEKTTYTASVMMDDCNDA